MSTHALLAYKSEDGKYVAKHSHYGAYSDYIDEIRSASNEEIKESVDNGDSSEPLGGFYSDEEHCMRLGWPKSTYLEMLKKVKPRTFTNWIDVTQYADECGASYIYLRDGNKTKVFEYNDCSHMPPWSEMDDEFDLDVRFFDGVEQATMPWGQIELSFNFRDNVTDEKIKDIAKSLQESCDLYIELKDRRMSITGEADDLQEAIELIEEAVQDGSDE